MYKVPKYRDTSISEYNVEIGTPMETKIQQVLENNDNMQEAPIIYTEKKDGVNPAYNIRTDKWEVAVETMDKIHRNHNAKGDQRMSKGDKEGHNKEIKEDGEHSKKDLNDI